MALGLVTAVPVPAEAHGPKTWWTHAYPFGEPPADYTSYQSIQGPARSFSLPSVDSTYAAKQFRWRGWGTARAVGRGRVQYCDSSGCRPWRKAKIVLTMRYRFDCADGLGNDHDYHSTYRRSQVSGFAYFRQGETLTVPKGTARC